MPAKIVNSLLYLFLLSQTKSRPIQISFILHLTKLNSMHKKGNSILSHSHCNTKLIYILFIIIIPN